MAESLFSDSLVLGIKVSLSRNDGAYTQDANATRFQKFQYFYWCFPLLATKIAIE